MNTETGSSTFQSRYLLVFLKIQGQEPNGSHCFLECPAIKLVAPLDSINLSDLDSSADHYENLNRFLIALEDKPSDEAVHSVKSSEERIARQLAGRVLYGKARTIFEEDLKTFARGRRIILVVCTESTSLEQIPWELLGHPELVHDLELGSRLGICRGLPSGISSGVPRSASSTILLAGSMPLTKNSPNVEDEFKRIQEQIRARKGEGSIALLTRRNVEYLALVKELKQKPTVFHVATHGTRNAVSFKHGDRDQSVPYDTFIDDITRIDSIQLVVLNVCYSARSDQRVFSLARHLVERGVPAVIGMATMVTPRASTVFSERLYLSLVLGNSVVEAYDSAIDYLRMYGEFDQILWSTPMLYHSHNVIPFPTVAKHKSRLQQSPSLPWETFEEALHTFEEFRLAFGEVEPDSSWTTNDWRTSTMPITFLYHSLAQSVQSLKYLPPTNHPQSVSWLLQFKDASEELEKRLARFQQYHETLMAGKARFNANDLSRAYMNAGKRLIEQFAVIRQLMERQ